eukprot:TRINITY_DN54914_c0_g1_i1.p1 TRINITY_DN54914_c0_g1~~TRINITY_DN54914_c0_g1_i1.p1  ORF type:complete len:266 (+),score=77.64 TRINITY_DN54914_c0_g1_i1:71-868(+)
MITITPPAAPAGQAPGISVVAPSAAGEAEAAAAASVQAGSESDADEMRRRISKGGTIRHNVSTAQLLSDDQHGELLEWVARENGPWTEDVREFPGPQPGQHVEEASSEAELYKPALSGFHCEIFRNEYLAWCASLQLPEDHPDFGRRPNELLGQITVHGGLTSAEQHKGRFCFDCNHTSTDLVPYAAFVSRKNDKKRVGGLAPVAGGGGGLSAPKAGGGKLLLPGQGGQAAPPPPKGATYKDYHFVRQQLESLAAQFLARRDVGG